MTDKGIRVGLLCSVIDHTAVSVRENDLRVFGKRPQRERRGIEMKLKGLK